MKFTSDQIELRPATAIKAGDAILLELTDKKPETFCVLEVKKEELRLSKDRTLRIFNAAGEPYQYKVLKKGGLTFHSKGGRKKGVISAVGPSVPQEAFDRIYDKLEARLNIPGEIRTADAYHLSDDNYCYTSQVFKNIMNTMIEQKKAERIHKGLYRILKPNTPQTATT